MQTEIISDGRTVWVNADDGCCLARFSWAGIDIHKDAKGQMSSRSHCLDCKAGPTSYDDWLLFKDGMIRYHGIEIEQRHMPAFLQGE